MPQGSSWIHTHGQPSETYICRRLPHISVPEIVPIALDAYQPYCPVTEKDWRLHAPANDRLPMSLVVLPLPHVRLPPSLPTR